MRQSLFFVGVLALSTVVVAAVPTLGNCAIQDPTTSPSQTQTPAQPTSQPPAKPSTSAPNSPKPAKVWTNENLADANGPVSVVGDPKKPSKGQPVNVQPADPQYIANARKQLEKLQSQLTDADKQIAVLKDFISGEPVSYSGYQYRKGYDREPVDAQIHDLEEKKKQTKIKIDALFEEARKKGVEPGQLR